MTQFKTLLLSFVFLFTAYAAEAQEKKKGMYDPGVPMPEKYEVDDRIDNMGYWRRMAEEKKVPVQPRTKVPEPRRYSTKIFGRTVVSEDSPDVPVTDQESTQSENSVFVDPSDSDHALNSNNSTTINGSVLGANDLKTDDGGETWYGNLEGTGGENSGDPAAAISLDGRMYNGFIHSSGGQGVAYSEDNGESWTSVLVGEAPGGFGSLLDKNHLWIDNSPSSPYEGNVYSAWTAFGGANDNEIEIVRSDDGGLTWNQPRDISSPVNAGNHNQGVNIGTGPNGEVYVVWTIYDSWPTDENAMAMARSFDGGETWETFRIIENIRGIRNSETSKNMRVNAFPSMDVDISNGANQGTIYVTWTNIGYPGENDGPDMDIYMIKSTDDGDTWSEPIRVNQDEPGLGTEHYFPWISCDPVTGALSVIYYDDRNVSSSEVEVFVSTSIDGGESWEDLRVSDVATTPSPIPGLASGYMGDYLGIDSYAGWTYPVWTDNRTGTVMSYVSPFLSGPPPNQPWVIYEEHSINDEAGNNNGLFDYDESLMFDVTLANIGDEPASDVNVTLTTESPYVTIDDGTENFGDFDPEDVIEVTDAFGVTVAPEIPNGESVNFILTSVDANDSTFTSGFSVEANAPDMKIDGMTVTETEGDGNGFLDPGEEGQVAVTLSNPGAYNEEQVIASLSSASDDISILNSVSNIGTLEAGEEAVATFNIAVSETAQEGSAVILPFEANSELHSVAKDFTVKIGVIIEDWETGDFESFGWENDEDHPWVIVTEEEEVYEGDYAVRSGEIDDDQSSELTINYGVLNDDSISFYVRTSTEASYDYLRFYIDGEMIDQWAGETEWQYVAYPILAGEHTITWAYEKDGSVSSGEDVAWIDYIEFPAALRTTAFAGTNIETCVNTTVSLSGDATLWNEVEWTTSGTGSFETPEELETIYVPSEDDYANGEVELTMTVEGPTETVTSSLTVSFFDMPEITMQSDLVEICQNDSIMMEMANAENYSQLEWITEGDGAFSDSSEMHPVYHPGEEDIANGMAQLILSAAGNANCEDVSDTIMLKIHPAPTASMLADNVEACMGDAVTIDMEFTGTAPYEIVMADNDTVMAESDAMSYEMAVVESSTIHIQSVTDANGCKVMMPDSVVIEALPLPEFDLAADTVVCHNLEVTLDVTTEGAAGYLWEPTGEETPEITVDSASAGLGTTTYTAAVTTENGCITEKSIDITFEDCTSIPENENAVTYAVFPNPNKGVFTLRLEADENQKVTWQVIDRNGKEVYPEEEIRLKQAYEQELDLSHLSDGVYFLKITYENYTHTQKVIISK